ncbi:hypothetical protein WM42_1041 [Corynebacterium simulans]|nr:hypothetical protein WM42_1041 [Corynebacterium simulans]
MPPDERRASVQCDKTARRSPEGAKVAGFVSRRYRPHHVGWR